MGDPLDAVIIGGGISGLACARRLCDHRVRFLLLSDHLGGRMYHSADGAMNFGATYVHADYHRVLRYVGRQIRFRLHETHFQQRDGLTTLFHWRSVRFAGPLMRLVYRLQELRGALEAFRNDAEQVPQDQLRARHPLIDRYSRQPAEELIDELGMRAVDERYAGPAFRTTAFAPPSAATALFYLASLLPMIVRTWVADFSRAYQRLTAGYESSLVADRVVAVRRSRGDLWAVHTARGAVYPARNVVIAAPYPDAREFYPVPQPHHITSATMLFVRGRRRPSYQGKRCVVLMPSSSGIASFWHQGYDWDQVYALCPQPELSEVYETWEILRSVSWKTAIVLSDADWAPLLLEPGLYLIGDYNLCGLEDSCVTGICAANHILRSGTSRGRPILAPAPRRRAVSLQTTMASGRASFRKVRLPRLPTY